MRLGFNIIKIPDKLHFLNLKHALSGILLKSLCQPFLTWAVILYFKSKIDVGF